MDGEIRETTWQERLAAEIDELEQRHEKLSTYILNNRAFAELGAEDRRDLHQQHDLQRHLIDVLHKRYKRATRQEG